MMILRNYKKCWRRGKSDYMILDVLSIAFKWVINTSLIASLSIGIILIIKKCAGNKLNPNWHYCLWLIVVIRLIVPFNFSSSISIFNYLKLNSFYASNTQIVQKPVENAVNQIHKSIKVSANKSTKDINNQQTNTKQINNSMGNQKSSSRSNTDNGKDETSSLDILDIAAVIWIVSIASALVYMFFIQYKFNKKIQKGVQVKCTCLINMMNDCKKVMGISENIGIVRKDYIKSPVLYGVINPKILLPEGFDDSLDLKDLKYIFFHELSHYKRKDIILNYICNFLQIVYWFNPIIWYGFYKMKNDREAACDSMALSYLGEETKIEYGKTVLKLVKSYSEFNIVPGLAGVQSSKHVIKERVGRIKAFEGNKSKLSIINIVTLIISILFLFTTAASNVAEAKVKSNNDDKYEFKIGDPGDPTNWMKPFNGNYTHVFSDKTMITMKYAYVDGGKFDIKFIEELKDKRMMNFRIYSSLKNGNSIIKPKSSWFSDISEYLLHKPKGMVIQWNKTFAAPKSLEKNYTIVLTKKVNNKSEKCEIRIPLYKPNINLYKGIKLNKVLKIKGGTITFKSINISPHTVNVKDRFQIDTHIKVKSDGREYPYLEYSFYADGMECVGPNDNCTASEFPTADKSLFRYIANSGFRYYINKPNNVKIKDIKVVFDTFKSKVVKVPIPCKNKTINLCNSKILIKKGYKKGKRVFLNIDAVKLEDLTVGAYKDYLGKYYYRTEYQRLKPSKNGVYSGRIVICKYIKKNYVILKVEKQFKNVLATYPGEVDIPLK
jgi:beta-lactamase regulating signal transducer with metallopeptidase domain